MARIKVTRCLEQMLMVEGRLQDILRLLVHPLHLLLLDRLLHMPQWLHILHVLLLLIVLELLEL